MSLCAQALGGFGYGISSTASFAIISSYDANNRERFIGYMEAANGLGLLFGPIVGAGLYHIGGFPLPFFFFAGLYSLGYPFISYILYKQDNHMRQN